MTPFEKAFLHTVGIEGDYSDHPADSGGATRYGITTATARLHGYYGAMNSLPLEKAKEIYRLSYWDLLKLDGVDAISPSVALKVFDTAVNAGQAFAARTLQRVLNVLNYQQRYYPDISVDGLIGPATVSALRGLVKLRSEEGITALLLGYHALLGAHYIELAERREKDEAFVFGWLMQRVKL